MTKLNLTLRPVFSISTHTLTWSVTSTEADSTTQHGISTHTLTWSVTLIFKLTSIKHIISTHTLTWSVTLAKRRYTFTAVHFNSHAHVERDAAKGKGDEALYISTHTLTWSVTGAKNE